MTTQISKLYQDEDDDQYNVLCPVHTRTLKSSSRNTVNKSLKNEILNRDDVGLSEYANQYIYNGIYGLSLHVDMVGPLSYNWTDIQPRSNKISSFHIRSHYSASLHKIMQLDPCYVNEIIIGVNMKKTKIQQKMISDVTKKGDIIQDYMYDIALSKIKHKFGNEIYMNTNLINYNDPNDSMLKLFNKLIKDFNTRYRTADGKILPNFMTVNKLAKHTYIYIASGTYIPDVVDTLYCNKNITYDLYMYIWGIHSKYYYNKINEIIQRVEKKATGHSLYVINSTTPRNYDITLLSFSNRDIESLVYSYNEDKIVTKFIDKFLSDMEYYEKKQLNYKRGILLYSEPGTGKSSLVKALACKYKRSICQINIGSIDKVNFNELTSMINADDEKYIVLFEDIDTLYLNRDKITEDGKNYNDIINGLLQFLDSTASPNNVIFIATTNHFDRLDEALIRDGRFDLKLEIKPLKKEDIPRFLKTLEFNGNIDDVLKAYGEPDERGLYNQSKLQNIILQLR